MITTENQERVFHAIDWASTKQRRVSHSSYGAEILACSDADDRGFYLKQSINCINKNDNIKHVLHVDSMGLFDTISALHDDKEYRLRQTVQRIRDSFEDGDIDILRWIPSRRNIADGLTKRCTQAHRRLNSVCREGNLCIREEEIRELKSQTWK